MMKNSFFLKAGIAVFTLLASQFAFAGQAGTVTFKTGDVSIIRADKTIKQAAKNDALNAGDTVETKDGRLQLALIDGGKVSLQPNTIYRINKYEFSGKEDGTEYGFTELIKGGLRTISGLIGHKNRDRYQLKTAVATIGIRGTEFTVNFNNNQLLMTTNHGSVDVCNEGGCLNATTGQSIGVAGPGKKPKPSDVAATASAAAPVAEETKVASNDSKDSNSNSKSDTKSNSSSTSTSDPTVTSDAASDSGAGTATDTSPGTTTSPGATADASSGTTTASNSGSGSSSSGSSGSGSSGSGSSGSGSSGSGNGYTVASPTTNTGIPTVIAGKTTNDTIVSLATMQSGVDHNGVYKGDITLNGKNLAQYVDNSKSPTIVPGTILEGDTESGVNYGRASGGTYNGLPMLMTTWITGTAAPAGAMTRLVGDYNVVKSTAPYMVSNNVITAVGSPNSVTGNLHVDFTNYSFNYTLTVPIAGATYTQNSVGSLTAGSAKFRDVGSSAGLLAGGSMIEGSLFGNNAQAAGLQYGFSVMNNGVPGNVWGAAVLKK